ncbi:MAG: S8 family serine peptidase, partial [Calditrichaeota bacterium]|nr:S8 family serine peptidase [Calditrichota bacterium]
MMRFFAVLCSLMFLLFSAVQANAPRGQKMQENAAHAPGRLLIKLNPTATAIVDASLQKSSASVFSGLASLDALHQQAGAVSVAHAFQPAQNRMLAEQIGINRWFMVEMDKEADILALAEAYESDPNVESVSPDWQAFPAAVPNDPLYSSQWGHNNTGQMLSYCWSCGGHPAGSPVGTPGFDANAQAAWDNSQGYGSASIIIGIIDSGVDIDHPDLRLVAGWDYGSNDSNPDDNSASPGHGTACAGVAAARANNGLGVSGIAGGCSVMPLKVANNAGSMFFSSIQNALIHAADNGAHIASMSLGASISSDAATDNALAYAYNSGVVLFAATGNYNQSTISYPAINTNVISVGAASPCGDRKRSSSSSSEVNPGVSTDPNGYTCDGERWWGSNYGSTSQDARTAVDIIAPTIMPTTDIQGSGGYDSGDYSLWFNGTSCATPYAAGVAALVMSQHPTWSPAQVRAQLTSTAIDIQNVESGAGWDRYTGYGMVDAAAATGGGGPTNQPPVAVVNGPYTGIAGTAVSFSSAGSNDPDGTITGYSWNFGDNSSSSAANPSHTYASAGTYTVTLTVTDNDGAQTSASTTATISPSGGGGTWEVITYDDFESGWGNYVDGGADCRRSSSDAAYAHQGTYCVRIQDNTSTSIFSYGSGRDVTGYDEIRVSFWYYPRSMDNSNEDFWVQYYDGATWHTVASYARNIDFQNNNFYRVDDVIISRTSYNFPTNMRIRFRCDASGNSDWVYIDEVEVAGRSNAA